MVRAVVATAGTPYGEISDPFDDGGRVNLELAHEFTYQAALNVPVSFGAGPLGSRVYFEVTGGHATGPRFTATAVGGGGDWVLVGPDGYGRIDVRMQFKTHDDAFVYVQYVGLLEMNDAVGQVLAAGAGTDYEDQYFRTALRFETGDVRYAWLNTSVFVARGHFIPGPPMVEYEVYRLL
jgi:hypothetical protein